MHDHLTPSDLTAMLYDVSVPDWPGELDFYRQSCAEATPQPPALLEIACGTGRIALRLAPHVTRLVGTDLSPQMLAVARLKAAGQPNLRFFEADMRLFDLGEHFDLVIMPGHSFQFMLTAADQLAALAAIRRHLQPGGTAIIHLDHQDVRWLGELRSGTGGVFEPSGEYIHPSSGRKFRISHAWIYAPATQTATVVTRWEEVNASGQVLNRWQRDPIPLHCIFRFEMEHLLHRTGFKVRALYGDFFRCALDDDSREMIWVVGA